MKNELFKVGDRVKIEEPTDSTMNLEFKGLIGTIVRIITDRSVGNSPIDPLFIILFNNGKEDGFWQEELERV